MDTKEIYDIIRKKGSLASIFLGVFPSDMLPKVVKKRPSAIIINTDPANKPGKHWVAAYFNNDNSVEYFDSYGLSPFNNEILNFLSENSSVIYKNGVHLQGLNSLVCGLYCIFFLYFKCRGYSLNKILKFFDKNRDKNDAKVCNFMYKKFEYIKSICCKIPNAQTCVSYCKNV